MVSEPPSEADDREFKLLKEGLAQHADGNFDMRGPLGKLWSKEKKLDEKVKIAYEACDIRS